MSQCIRFEVAGVPVILAPSAALPLVHVLVARRFGATTDPVDGAGLCRIAARLARRTAGGRALPAIEEGLDRMGASLVTDAGYSTVAFNGVTLKRSLGAYTELLADLLVRPSLDANEHERLLREARAELLEARDSDRALANRALRQTLFAGHPYGRSVSGTLASLPSLTLERVRQHHAEATQRSQFAIALAGDLDEAAARALVLRLVSDLPDGQSTAPRPPEPKAPTGRQLVLVDKPERTQTQIYLGLLGSHVEDPDHLALHVAATVFGGSFSSRLMQAVRVERGWSYGAYASLPVDQVRQAMTLWTFPKAEDCAPCVALQLQLLEELVDKGLTQRELTGARRMLSRSHAFAIDTASKRASLGLDALTLGLPADYYDHYVERINAVQLDEANAALRARLDPSRLVVAVTGTAENLRSGLEGVIPGLTSTQVLAYDSDTL